MPKVKKFSGELIEPLPSAKIGVLMAKGDRDKVIAERAEIESHKINLLWDHYGLEVGNYHSLVLELARDFVPGFSEETPRGRPIKWDLPAKGFLYIEVERMKSQLAGHEDDMRRVCTLVSELPRWRDFISHIEGVNRDPDPAETVRKIYFNTRSSSWVKIYRDAYQYSLDKMTEVEWDESADDHLKNSSTGQGN